MVGLRSSAAIALLVVFVCMAHGTPYTLSNMPAYNWYHGCGPTAAASVIGYWDLLGYTNLFDASGADVYQTSNVQDQISSPAHNAKYDPHPDDPDLPVPPNTSIACWFRTSVGQPYGWSYLSYSDDAFSGYAQYRGYTFNSWYQGFGTGAGEFYWDDFMDEIDAGRPLMFLVDTDGNNVTDHFVPAFGYDDRGAEGLYYACYDTWSEAEAVRWYRFRKLQSGNTWGISAVTYAQPEAIPEPATFVLFACGLAVLVRRRRRKAD